MSDLISREAAFDEIIWNSDNGVIDARVAIEALRKLPSVEPEKRTEERTETYACDCISRNEAIDVINHVVIKFPGLLTDRQQKTVIKTINLTTNAIGNALIKLKSVEPERKPGHWEWDQRTGEYVCSECGCNPIYKRTTPDVSEIDKYRFCRWCGAPMEVVNADENSD